MPNAVRHSEIESDPVRDSPLFASHYSLKSPGMRHKAGLNSLSFYISTYKTMNAVNQPDFSRFPAVASRPHVRSSPESRILLPSFDAPPTLLRQLFLLTENGVLKLSSFKEPRTAAKTR